MREENDCFVENAISIYAAAGIHGKRRMNRTVCLSGEQESPNVRQRHSGFFIERRSEERPVCDKHIREAKGRTFLKIRRKPKTAAAEDF